MARSFSNLTDKLSLSTAAAAAAIALLTGCSGGSSLGGALPAGGNALSNAARSQQLPPCVVSIWASSLGGGIVQGYSAPATPCGAPINGSSSGTPFAAPFGLATDHYRRLYVADVNNSRVVVFSGTGAYLSTLHMQAGEQPYSVCVSPKGIVGVVDRPASSNGTGDVEFFKSYQGGMFTQASGVLNTFSWCAFDKRDNFFADGTVNYSGGGTKIVYLPAAQVFAGGSQTMNDSFLGTASYWMGMYVQIGFQHNLTVGVAAPTIQLQNFKITPAGVPTAPAGWPRITTLAGYPATSNPFYQAAPTTGGPAATIVIADYGNSTVISAPVGGALQAGGTTSPYASLSTTVGVATSPTGQF